MITLHLGDCLDVLRTLEPGSVDAVVTDPPYGVKHRRGDSRLNVAIMGDDRPPRIEWVAKYPAVVWGGNNFCDQLPRSTGWLVWDKHESEKSRHSHAELAWTNAVKAIRVHRQSFRGFTATASHDSDRVHPNQKPVKLIRWCLGLLALPEGSTVFDPYMGSGTTGVACVQLGLNFIGVEIDPTYHAIAARRIADEQAKTALLEPVA
jgi:site-specific DNA-methyltransferase (adenine-specific)